MYENNLYISHSARRLAREAGLSRISMNLRDLIAMDRILESGVEDQITLGSLAVALTLADEPITDEYRPDEPVNYRSIWDSGFSPRDGDLYNEFYSLHEFVTLGNIRAGAGMTINLAVAGWDEDELNSTLADQLAHSSAYNSVLSQGLISNRAALAMAQGALTWPFRNYATGSSMPERLDLVAALPLTPIQLK